ncbi:MAG: hypothetical protein AAB631_01755 [Patescibacteria group bacterium]
MDSSAKDLWGAVERAACTERYPAVTFAILRHMVEIRIVPAKIAYDPHPNQSDILEAMLDYTQAGLIRNFYLVRNVLMGKEPLTEENYKTLRVGDTVVNYRMPVFGPIATPFLYPVVRVDTVDTVARLYYSVQDVTDELKYVWFSGNPFVAIRRKK